MKLLAAVLLSSLASAHQAVAATSIPQETLQAPIATQWTLDAVGDTVGPVGITAVQNVYRVVCSKSGKKGTGFLIDNGVIVSNEHVVRGCGAAEVVAFSSFGDEIVFTDLKTDNARDLAALSPTAPLKGGLTLGTTAKLEVGNLVRAWGHPLGYNGPPPLLSVGYLSGFRAHSIGSGAQIKHLVVNAAFNAGNSGGPLFAGEGNAVVGVVVSKALPPFTPTVESAIQAFAKNRNGLIFSGTGDDGKPVQLVESQVVAMMIASLQEMAQVMIGEAIAVEELKAFLGYKGNTK